MVLKRNKIFLVFIMLVMGLLMGCSKKSDTTADLYKLDISEKPQKWSDTGLEIANSLYEGFVPAAAEIDGKWEKALYSAQKDLLIIRDSSGEYYNIYHGSEKISVAMTLPFPTDINVQIKLVDINEDGKDELYISEFVGGDGGSDRYIIGLEPFEVLTDVYKLRDVYSIVTEYVVQTKLYSDGKDTVQADFVVNNKSYSIDMDINSDTEGAGEYSIAPSDISITSYDSNEPLSLEIRFELYEAGDAGNRGYIFVNIPLTYDKKTNHYIMSDEAVVEYRQ